MCLFITSDARLPRTISHLFSVRQVRPVGVSFHDDQWHKVTVNRMAQEVRNSMGRDTLLPAALLSGVKQTGHKYRNDTYSQAFRQYLQHRTHAFLNIPILRSFRLVP